MKKELSCIMFLLLTTSAIIFWQSPFILQQLNKQNIRKIAVGHRSEKNNDSAPISLPSGNAYLNALILEAASYRFDYKNYGINEDYDEFDLPKDDTYLHHSIGKLKFLQLSQDYISEEKVLKSYVQREDFMDYNVRSFMSYLDENYLPFVSTLVEENHVWEARELVGLTYRRLNLFDSPPLSNLEFGNRIVIDEIFLLNVFFNDPRLLLSEKETLLKFIALVDSDKKDFEKLTELLKERNKKLIPNDILDYFDGIKYFYKKDYKSSFEIFDRVSKESRNNPLVDLANIMKIRCLFWSQKWEASPWLTLEESKDMIKFIGEKILRRTLKSDVPYYLDSLSITPFQKAKILSEINE